MSMTDDILVTPSLHLAEQLSTHRRCHRLLVVSKETKASSAVRAFENELGVQAPLGFWDPAGLSSDARLEKGRKGAREDHESCRHWGRLQLFCSFSRSRSFSCCRCSRRRRCCFFFLAIGSMVGRGKRLVGVFIFGGGHFGVIGCERWGTRSWKGTLLQSTAFPHRSHQ